MKAVTVTVRRNGDTNIARVGKGGYARTASSTNAPYFAAHAAAEKFLIEGRAHLNGFEVRLSPTWEENANAESYTATLVKKVRPAAKPLRKTSVVNVEAELASKQHTSQPAISRRAHP